MDSKPIFIIVISIVVIFIHSSGCIGTSDNSTSPYRIYVTASPATVAVNGSFCEITAQLYRNGVPYNASSINISFEPEDDSFWYLTPRHYNLTDENGSTTMLFISGKNLGHFQMSANCTVSGNTISNSTYVSVVESGTISGLVLDKNGNGTGVARVTLWNVKYNDTTGRWDNQDIYDIEWRGSGYSRDNPVTTSFGNPDSTPGAFIFNPVPAGMYNITVETINDVRTMGQEPHRAYSIVKVDKGTVTPIITLSDYEFDGHWGDYYFPSHRVMIPPDAKSGVIWGIVSDFVTIGINGANVTLYNAIYNDTSKQWDRAGIANVPDNPQLSKNTTADVVGAYQFDQVPSGDYIVTAEFRGQDNFATAHVNNNVSTNFISLWVIPPI